MLYIAIVMYNKKIADVLSRYSANRLLERHGEDKTHIIMVDNSETQLNDDDELKDFIAKHGIAYIHNGKNLGLSKAYNQALEYALHDSEDPNRDFLMLLDDDTDLTYPYMHEIYAAYKEASGGAGNEASNETSKEASNEASLPENSAEDKLEKKINVITGLIESGGRPMSPIYRFSFSYSEKNCITTPGTYENICCISSGMAVRLSALEKVGGFEESLFLDMIDYTLMYQLNRRKFNNVQVVNAKLEQSFSGRQLKPRREVMARYNIYCKDFTRYCEITRRGRLYAKLHLLKRRISLEKSIEK